jgi:hypothetical protein
MEDCLLISAFPYCLVFYHVLNVCVDPFISKLLIWNSDRSFEFAIFEVKSYNPTREDDATGECEQKSPPPLPGHRPSGLSQVSPLIQTIFKNEQLFSSFSYKRYA